MAPHQAPPSLRFSRQEHWSGLQFPLQCMKVKRESEVAQSCPTLNDSMDCSPPGSSVRGIFQARVLEWGAIAFSALPIPSNYQSTLFQLSTYKWDNTAFVFPVLTYFTFGCSILQLFSPPSQFSLGIKDSSTSSLNLWMENARGSSLPTAVCWTVV